MVPVQSLLRITALAERNHPANHKGPAKEQIIGHAVDTVPAARA